MKIILALLSVVVTVSAFSLPLLAHSTLQVKPHKGKKHKGHKHPGVRHS
ncbi:MAG TPA: hypothetical protein VH369_15240 [Bryobacteraceae bacterium]|jgi:hypothetical protein